MGGNWSRQHDALIAERAEGRAVYKGNDWTGNPYDLYWVHVEPNGSGQCPVPVPHYNTDLAAVARAMEAWRAQDADFRAYEIEAVGGSFRCECRDWKNGENLHAARFMESADNETAARAAALLRALGGGE